MFFDNVKREDDACCLAGKEETRDGVAIDGVIFNLGVLTEERSDVIAESCGEVEERRRGGDGIIVNNEDFGGFCCPLRASVVYGYRHD